MPMRWCDIFILPALMCLVALIACNKAPNGIIKESDMVDLLVDLHKAEAYTENFPSQFPDDSTHMMLKQSVFAKHGVTQADFDTSLVWYAHNMETYTDVYRRVIDKLNHEYKNSSRDNGKITKSLNDNGKLVKARSYYKADGDTADLWSISRNWVLFPGMKMGYIPFDIEPDRDYRLGDCYELKFKALESKGNLSTVIAVDYSDGGTAYLHHSDVTPMWNSLILQSDSMRVVRRIYGYIKYNLTSPSIAYLDSVQLLRMHINDNTYAARINTSRVVERKVKNSDRPLQAQKPAHELKGAEYFTPKEGLNKSSVNRHIQSSPNARHLPSRH